MKIQEIQTIWEYLEGTLILVVFLTFQGITDYFTTLSNSTVNKILKLMKFVNLIKRFYSEQIDFPKSNGIS